MKNFITEVNRSTAIIKPNGEMPNKEYHEHMGLSSSGLWKFHNECPAQFKFEDKIDEDDKPDCLKFGTATHEAVLEPGLFEKHFEREVSKEDFPRYITSATDAKKLYKEICGKPIPSKLNTAAAVLDYFWAHFKDEKHEDGKELFRVYSVDVEEQKKRVDGKKTIIAADKYDDIMKMRDSIFKPKVLSNAACRDLIVGSQYEMSVIVDIKVKGYDGWITVKVRPDLITKDCFVPDYKTVDGRSSMNGFHIHAKKNGYWFRQVFVCDVLSAVYGRKFVAGLIAHKKTSPYIATPFILDHEDNEEAIEITREEVAEAVANYAKCLRDDYWPGYSGDGQPRPLEFYPY